MSEHEPCFPSRPSALREALDQALAGVEDPQKLVGKAIPFAAIEWAEKNGLDVQQSAFAPPGRLFIIGAVPVPWPANSQERPNAS